MLASLQIKNFRCFESLRFDSLGRINLIGGKNNTGKTSVLEAINLHQHPADPTLAISINAFRGIDKPSNDFEGKVGWLFRGKYPEAGFEVSSSDDRNVSRMTEFWMGDGTTMRDRFPEAQKKVNKTFGAELIRDNLPRIIIAFKQNNETSTHAICIKANSGDGWTWFSFSHILDLPCTFLPSGGTSVPQDIDLFGKLELAKRQETILPALRIVEPRLTRLALVPLAKELVIHGDIGLSKLIPVPFMGEGIRRLLSIALAIANSAHGTLLIDEIENGLHYSVLIDVWKAIAQAARDNDVQVFATTHSWECIEAAHRAFEESPPYELRYHRLERVREQIVVKTFDEQNLSRIEKTDLEIR